MAFDYGIPDAEINDMSPAELERSVFHMHRLAQNLRRDNDRQQIMQQATEPKFDQNLIAREPGTETPRDPGVDEELGFDPTEYDPHIVGALKRLAKENKELRGLVGQVVQREQFRQNVEVGNRIDKAFFSLGEAFKPYFGDLPMAQMTKADAEGHRRMAVLKVVEGMAKEPGTLEQKISKAAKLLYPTTAPEPRQTRTEPPAQTNGTRISPEEWEAARVARPTHRGGAPEPKEKGYDAAVKGVARAMQDMQASGDTSGETSLDGFPD